MRFARGERRTGGVVRRRRVASPGAFGKRGEGRPGALPRGVEVRTLILSVQPGAAALGAGDRVRSRNLNGRVR